MLLRPAWPNPDWPDWLHVSVEHTVKIMWHICHHVANLQPYGKCHKKMRSEGIYKRSSILLMPRDPLVSLLGPVCVEYFFSIVFNGKSDKISRFKNAQCIKVKRNLSKMKIASGDLLHNAPVRPDEKRFWGFIWCNSLAWCSFQRTGLLTLNISSALCVQPSHWCVSEFTHKHEFSWTSPKAADQLTDRKLDRQTWIVPMWLPQWLKVTSYLFLTMRRRFYLSFCKGGGDSGGGSRLMPFSL